MASRNPTILARWWWESRLP